MKKPKLTPEQERVKNAIEYLQKYFNTYDQQFEYLNYTDDTIINDVLYGLGVALEPKEHQFATGFRKFKKKLITFLTTN